VSVDGPAGEGAGIGEEAGVRVPGIGSAGAGVAVGGKTDIRLLFVCLGNICRSPTAEGTMRALVRQAGLEGRIVLDSAGTGGWHVGDPPDARAAAAARRRGIVLEGAARQVRHEDFEEFDLILAMDRANLRELRRLAPDERARARVRLLREFDPAADVNLDVPGDPSTAGDLGTQGDLDVPDPYYGGPDGFDRVLDLVQAACASLLDSIQRA
jgi:protein-tyrosine phosphatase